MLTKEQKLKQYALNLLGKREYSIQMLGEKLTARAYNLKLDEQTSETLVSEIVFELLEKNYLSDTRFTELFIRQSIDKQRGPNRIAQELRQKGVAQSLIEEALERIDSDWQAIALQALAKKFKPELVQSAQANKSEDFESFDKLKHKMHAKLSYNGFGFDVVGSAVDTYIKQCAEAALEN